MAKRTRNRTVRPDAPKRAPEPKIPHRFPPVTYDPDGIGFASYIGDRNWILTEFGEAVDRWAIPVLVKNQAEDVVTFAFVRRHWPKIREIACAKECDSPVLGCGGERAKCVMFIIQKTMPGRRVWQGQLEDPDLDAIRRQLSVPAYAPVSECDDIDTHGRQTV